MRTTVVPHAASRRRRPRALLPLVIALPLLGAGPDPSASVIVALAVIYATAVLAGDLAVRFGQPAVLGELLGGVALGNLHLVGLDAFEFIKTDQGVDLLARIGVLILLFEVGVEATVAQMARVGWSALAVAVLGVAAPFALGWLMGAWLLPDHSAQVHAFLGATLSATSVGITARVLKDLDRSQTPEARIILGAAVVDDVLGLVVLAVVTGVIAAANAGTTLSYGAIAAVAGKAFAFLAIAVAIGAWLAPRVIRHAARFRTRGVALAVSLTLCFLTAWLAHLVGLAAIVGAFAAGLVLESAHYRVFEEQGEHPIETLLHPLTIALVPVFFVLMGMKTDLRSFVQPGVPVLALALTVAAVAGKQLCSLGVWDRGINRLAVGIGMVPRGEVGLIFANIGLGLTIAGERVISEATYSAVVVMVIVTTMVTPPLLKWSLTRRPASP
jgi:Kef-type K+ transport system membrane component KefB